MKIVLTIIALLLSASLAGAGVLYEWVDEQGVLSLRDTPPPGYVSPSLRDTALPSPKRSGKAKADANSSTTSPSQPESSASTPVKVRFTGTVELYITDWCGYCKKAQKYFADRGIPYVTYDIEKDSAANLRHKELGGRGIPLIVIGSKKISGFSQEKIERYLNDSK